MINKDNVQKIEVLPDRRRLKFAPGFFLPKEAESRVSFDNQRFLIFGDEPGFRKVLNI